MKPEAVRRKSAQRRTARPSAARGATSAGFTLVELLLALGLFALILAMLVRLLDATLATLDVASQDRERFMRESTLLNFLAGDFDTLSGGKAADLLVSTTLFDVDGDGIAGRPWPRLTFVRQVPTLERNQDTAANDLARALELSEVCWTVLPRAVPRATETSRGRRGDGVLVRIERPLESPEPSLFTPAAFGPGGQPKGAYEEVTAGVLWMRVLCAAQTTRFEDGWQVGLELEDAAEAWDARGGQRLDPDLAPQNGLHRALPNRAVDEPLLPRRVQVEFELEREEDLRRRTSNVARIEPGANAFRVGRPDRLPAPGSWILVGEEWMKLVALDGDLVQVQRGQRGTRSGPHAAGTPVQFGSPVVREFDVPWAKERWLR